MRSILVTGGAGFIGSNFIHYFLAKYAAYQIINLDKLTYAGDLSHLKGVNRNPNYRFIQGDICNRVLIDSIFKEYDIRGVIHFAAQSHVDRSINNPDDFIETNIKGTYHLIEAAKSYWMESPFNYRESYAQCRFHHISTDEVYGSLGEKGYFKETTPYAPNNPYSASKASSNLLVLSYFHTYGLDIVLTNCSNNYGPRQHQEKFIPTIIRKALALEPIPIYGDGKNVRDWLYVMDHCKGIDLAYHQGKAGESYNIGGNNEFSNREMAEKICEILDQYAPQYRKDSGLFSYKELIVFVKDRPGHDRRYAIDSTKIKKELGWRQEEDINTALIKTVEWYLKQH